MGSFTSKLMKNNCTDGSDDRDKSKEMIQIPDPRSPTGEIIRTPITIEKDINESSKETKTSLRKQALMKTVRNDPRSPSDNISRTPIFLTMTPVQKHSYNPSESPISVYSNDISDIHPNSELMTPEEPSPNVSGFGNYREKLDNLDDTVKTSKDESEESNNTKKTLKVSSKPSTIEARNILHEILSSVEFDEDFCLEGKRKKPAKQKSLSVHCDNTDYKINEKKDKLQHRTPLSNITLSTNSPNHLNSLKKPYARCKILTDAGLENSRSPKRQLAEWDKDKTVII
ncbi:UNVERIFIED_CONTAM: hypothetical protein PYX00_006389 [Menopon gallinae]|uniref:Exophilin 5 n=1 Tax=Menopon gallinae TaxID=328185 RepID=A0AAW2HWJ4_9NEOP